MLNKPPIHLLLWAVFFAILAALAYSYSQQPDSPPGWALFAWIVTWIMACSAASFVVVFFSETAKDYHFKMRVANSVTPASNLAEKLMYLDDAHLKAYMQTLETEGIDTGMSDGEYVVLDNIPVLHSFIVDELYQKSVRVEQGYQIPPIRRYGEGSRERNWYRAVEDFLDERDLLIRARGNQASIVTSWKAAWDAIRGTYE